MGQVLEGHEGNPIGADEQSRMKTYSTVFTEDHFAAVRGDAYVIDVDAVGVDAGDHLIVIKNDDDDDLVVTSITLFVVEFKDTSRLEVNLNETFAYGANGTVLTPVNMRSGIVGGADCTVYKISAAGTDITTFGGTAVKGGRFAFDTKPLRWVKESGWIIPKNQVFSLEEDAGSGGNTYRGYISFYYHR